MSTERFADLHLHTFHSDGTDSPDSLVARAQQQGLACMALTDHDTINGIAESRAAAERARIEFIAGVEITAQIDEHEVHILGYFVDPTCDAFLRFLTRNQEVRRDRIERTCARLGELGVPLSTDAVYKIAGVGSCGRPHIARALVEARHASSTKEAFHRWLGQGKPAFVPKWKPTVIDAARQIREAGGIPSLAHPGLAGVDSYIEEMSKFGLQAVEAFHTSHSTEITKHYLKVARSLGLLVTGGSDCHGQAKGSPTMGSVKLPYEYVEALKAASGKGVR